RLPTVALSPAKLGKGTFMERTQETKFRSPREMLDALAAVRDNARVRAHLLSLDARRRWQDHDSRLGNLETKIQQEGDRVTETASKKVRELTESMREFVREHQSTNELGAPIEQLMQSAKTCSPNDPLNQPARIMWEANCGVVPVVNEAQEVLGMLTDRDICMAAYTRGEPLSAISVQSAMSPQVACVSPKDSVQSVLRLMRERQIRRVPVVQDGRFVGIIA